MTTKKQKPATAVDSLCDIIDLSVLSKTLNELSIKDMNENPFLVDTTLAALKTDGFSPYLYNVKCEIFNKLRLFNGDFQQLPSCELAGIVLNHVEDEEYSPLKFILLCFNGDIEYLNSAIRATETLQSWYDFGHDWWLQRELSVTPKLFGDLLVDMFMKNWAKYLSWPQIVNVYNTLKVNVFQPDISWAEKDVNLFDSLDNIIAVREAGNKYYTCGPKELYAPEDCVRLLKAGHERGFIKMANMTIINKALNSLEQKILGKTATYEDNVTYTLTGRWIHELKDLSGYEVHPIIKVLLSDNPLKEILRDEKSTIQDHIETVNVLLKESAGRRIDSIEYFNLLLSEKLNNRQLDLLVCYFKLFTNEFHKLKKYERNHIVTLLSEHGYLS